MGIVFGFTGQAASATDEAQAEHIPWSGYWWPTTGGGLGTGVSYRGHPAPIEKYELLTVGSYPLNATQFYLEQKYDPQAPRWYGMCGDWAAASVFEHIEFYPSSIDNIIFYVGDKKGLLTACHDNDVMVKSNSHAPEVFHYWLVHYIKEQGLAFYAELDPGEEVWNYPVYRYQMDLDEGSSSINVHCRIWYVDDNVEPDFQGTVSIAKDYTYTLYKTGDEITGGQWTGNSIYDHPEQVNLPISQGSTNPYLDYAEIRTIAASKDDYLESEQPVAISPGGYNLILLNRDDYFLDIAPGDWGILKLTKIDSQTEGIGVQVTDAQGRVLHQTVVDDSTAFTFQAETPPYLLSLTRGDYGNDGVYRLEYDLKKSYEFAETRIQKGLGWGGYAILNDSDSPCDMVYVTGYKQDGSPMQTFQGPFSLAPGEKRIVLTSQIKTRNIEKSDLFGIKIISEKAVKVLSLSGYWDRNMSCFTPSPASDRMVIPDSVAQGDYSRSLYWGLYNSAPADRACRMTLLKAGGETVGTRSLSLPADSALHFSNDESPFTTSVGGGWILLEGDDLTDIKGYGQWLMNGLAKSESMGPLAVGRNFYIPHVIKNGFWDLEFILINVSDAYNDITVAMINGAPGETITLTLSPHQKTISRISDLFPHVDEAFLNRAALQIVSTEDMAGYFTYKTAADDLYVPLMTDGDLSDALTIPHVASNNYWWTGIVLFNPGLTPVSFDLIPFDAAGKRLDAATVRAVMDPMSKKVFMISDFWGTNADHISYARIQPEAGKRLLGIVGYGNGNCRMLSGQVLRN